MMRESCHRCGGDLPLGDDLTVFCPHCGAPQLFLSEACLAGQNPDQPSTAETTGAPPPPGPREIDWQIALRCVLLVAAVAAVLGVISLRLPGLSFLWTVWMLTASLSTLALYQRLRPLAWMDANVGARLGLTAGLALIVLVTASLALSGVVARFGLHAMAGFDATLAQLLAQAKLSAANSANPTPPDVLHLYDLPEFQAGLMLTSIAIGCFFLLVVSTAGGALGGLLRTRRRARA